MRSTLWAWGAHLCTSSDLEKKFECNDHVSETTASACTHTYGALTEMETRLGLVFSLFYKY